VISLDPLITVQGKSNSQTLDTGGVSQTYVTPCASFGAPERRNLLTGSITGRGPSLSQGVISSGNAVFDATPNLIVSAPGAVSSMNAAGQRIWADKTDGQVVAADSKHVVVDVPRSNRIVVPNPRTGKVDEIFSTASGAFAGCDAAVLFGNSQLALYENDVTSVGSPVSIVLTKLAQ
jgi:hypothetical protein